MNPSIEPLHLDERRMSHAEAVMLCRYAKAACPQQAFDDYTPDAWSDLLSDLLFEDCKAAVKAVVQRQPFVAPAEIRAEVIRIRNKRIVDFGPLPDPMDFDADDTTAYRRYIAITMRAIGDGRLKPGDALPPIGAPRDVIAELGQVGQDVPDA